MLFTEEGQIKLGEYDLRAYMRHMYRPLTIIQHMAPEVFVGKEERKSDVWSLGISIIEMAKGMNPFGGCNEWGVQNRLTRDGPASLSREQWSAECVDFVSKCVVTRVEERWSVEQLMHVRVVLESDK